MPLMSWWNLGGLNPKYKDFIDSHPDKTLIGMGWSMYWRFMIVVFVIEMFVFFCIMLFGVLFGLAFHPNKDVLLQGPSAVNTAERERQDCYDKYKNLFKSASDINDPLTYDKTNLALYECLSKLSNPLGI